MKKQLLSAIIIILALSIALTNAAVPKSSIKGTKNNDPKLLTANAPVKSIAYTIVTPAKTLPNGTIRPQKVYRMERLPQDKYLQGIIHIKTKSSFTVNKGDKTFQSKILQSSLANFDVKEIRQIFPNHASGNLLKNDNSGLGRMYSIHYDADMDPYDACIELMKNPEIEYAVPVFKRYMHYTSNDPIACTHLDIIKASKAWDISKGSSSIKIAIVDAGTQWDHEDLKDHIWVNTKEIAGDGIDNDGNGFKDDIHGWDFVGSVTSTQLSNEQYAEDNDPTNMVMGHGSASAGCASAVTDNSTGISSIGFSCSLIPIKCGSDHPTDASASEGIYRGYEAITYAADLGADIINCSWGGSGGSPEEQDVINYAYDKGVLIVVSAGNDGAYIDDGATYPAAYDNVMAVGASSATDKPSSFSNYGMLVKVYAPGENIMATLPANSHESNYSNKMWIPASSASSAVSGTSFSSPIVAGIAGLVKTVHPDWTPKKIMQQIRSTSENVLTTNSSLRPYYYGRANAYNALYYNNGDGPTIPGLEVSSIVYPTDSSYLSNYDKTLLTLKLTNYLGTASAVTIKITALDNFVTLDNSKVTYNSIATDEVKEIPINFTLQSNTPWYSGNVHILLTYTSGTYTDYQLLLVPFELPTKNSYTLFQSIGETYMPTWSSIHSPSSSLVYAFGQYGFYYYYYGITNGLTVVDLSNGGYSVHSTPDLIYGATTTPNGYLYGGSGPSDGSAAIYYTTNSGSKWTTVSVSTITPFVNDVKFFDNSNGIFLGDPNANDFWGVASTTDGGKTWTRVTNISTALSNEQGITGCSSWFGDCGWFGTSKGRVFKTTNQGKSWTAATVYSGAEVSNVAFSSKLNGVAVYTVTSSSATTTYAASTTDGGVSWKSGVYNFSTNNYSPVYLFSPDSSGIVCAQSAKSEVISSVDGSSWTPVLSKEAGYVARACGVNINLQKARLWQLGVSTGYLDFYYTPGTVKKTLTVSPDTTIVFDTTATGENNSKSVTVTNDGNVNITFTSVLATSDDSSQSSEFSTFSAPTGTLTPSGYKTFLVRFRPQVAGERTGVLTITSNADVAVKKIILKGYATQNTNSKILTATPDTQVTFDTTAIYTSSSQSVNLKSTGTASLNVVNATITSDDTANPDEFFVPTQPTGSISTGSSVDMPIIFAPKIIGKRTATLKINSDASDSIITISLIGYSKADVSVYEENAKNTILLNSYPNPTSENAYIQIQLLTPGFADLSLYNILGEKVSTIYSDNLDTTSKIIPFSTASLLPGTYYLELKAGQDVIYKKINITK